MDVNEKCSYHDDLRESIAEMRKENKEFQKEIRRCFTDLSVNLAENYVTKKEFADFCHTSEQRYNRQMDKDDETNNRIDDLLEEQKRYLWKIIGLFVPVSALVFSVITWLLGHI